ncbi:MAG: COX15/CtaA family protein [Alphaproteobacteria bacterium]|nr:COX15/CtaA family protein [Alphaproteobacteria bacterium]
MSDVISVGSAYSAGQASVRTDPSRGSPGAEFRSAGAALWLFAVAAIVLGMVLVGGATRLTGSGLSITQWRPVSGVVPPLNARDWDRLFALYRQSSQYRLINQGISLSAFQTLYWWEWGHRLLGRTLGVVFLAPFLVLLARRALPSRLIPRCVVLFGLGGLQGLVGWWMVKSGLEGRAAVLPERLATHLGLALLLLASLIWTGLEAGWGPVKVRRRDGWTWLGLGLMAALFMQCLLGALVAGNHAGLIDGDWPRMAGRWFPEGYWQGGALATFFHGLAAVQFNHRVMAYAILIVASVAAVRAVLTPTLAPALRTLILILALGLWGQGALGVATLWYMAPLPLALAHQVNASLMFSLSVVLAWRAQRA